MNYSQPKLDISSPAGQDYVLIFSVRLLKLVLLSELFPVQFESLGHFVERKMNTAGYLTDLLQLCGIPHVDQQNSEGNELSM